MRIFIAEEIPSLNKGEAAILHGIIKSLELIDNLEINLLSFDYDIDSVRYKQNGLKVIDGVHNLKLMVSFERSLILRILESIWTFIQILIFIFLYKIMGNNLTIMKNPIWNIFIHTDIILIGHDSAFAGLFGTIPFFKLYNLLIAKSLNKKTVFYAGTVEEFENRIQAFIGKFILNKIDLITLRDKKSLEYLKNLNLNLNNVHLTADVAYLLDPAPIKRVNDIFSIEHINKSKVKPLIGLTVTKEMCYKSFPEFESVDMKYKKSLDLMSSITDYLVERYDADLIFLPHCIGPTKDLDDRIISSDIISKTNNKNKIKLITSEYTPEELKGLIGQCDMFIGERLHSVVGAVSMGVPSIVILHNNNRNGLLEPVLNDEWICDAKEINFEFLKEKIDTLWFKRDEIRKELETKMINMRHNAQFNGKLLQDLGG